MGKRICGENISFVISIYLSSLISIGLVGLVGVISMLFAIRGKYKA